MNRLKILDIAYIALFAAVMAICAWISIPTTVPFTLQTFGVFLAVTVLGGKRGTVSVLVYLLLGAVGAPVFAGFTGGMGRLLGTTGGYIVGFLFTALIMWLAERVFGDKAPVLILSMVAGLIVCYAFGTAWFMSVYAKNTGSIGIMTALSWCVLPYIPADAIKLVLAFFVGKRLKKYIKTSKA